MLEEIRSFFLLGGWVMWPLSALSVLSLTLCLERAVFWIRMHGRARRRAFEQMRHRLLRDDLAGARSSADADSGIYGRFAQGVFSEVGAGARLNEGAMAGLIEDMRPLIERSSATLSAIITAAPLLGILGTVTGIIRSFQLLGGEDAISDPTLVADGIAEALFTTAFGLIIALATLFPYVIFRTQANRALGRLEHLATIVVDHLPQRASSSPE